MNKIGLAILAVAFAAIAVANVDGNGCITRQRVVVQQSYSAPTYSYAAPAYVAPVVATYFAPVPVFVPQYSVGYAPDLQKEREHIEMKLRIEQLEKKLSEPVPARAQGQQGHPAIAVMTRSCAKCHDETSAKAKGKGFTLLKSGVVADLTPDQILDVLDYTSTGFMPKGAKELSGEEVGHLLDYFAKRRKK